MEAFSARPPTAEPAKVGQNVFLVSFLLERILFGMSIDFDPGSLLGWSSSLLALLDYAVECPLEELQEALL